MSVGDGGIQTTTTTAGWLHVVSHVSAAAEAAAATAEHYQPPAAVAATSSSGSSGSTIREREGYVAGTRSPGHTLPWLPPRLTLPGVFLSPSIFPASDVTGTESGIDPERPPRPHSLSRTVLTG